jgi:hypothetical protein
MPVRKSEHTEDEEDEEEAEKPPAKRRKKEQPDEHVEESVPRYSQRDANYNNIHGTPEDAAELDSRLNQYSQEDWEGLIADVLGTHVDSDTTDSNLGEYVNLFYKIFCSPLKTEHEACDRVKSLYPNARTMKDQFQNILTRFGHMHIECLNRNWIDPEDPAGREMKRKLTLISFCIKTSFEQLVLTRMLQHAHDPMTRGMLSDLTPEAFFQDLELSKLKKHQQINHFYLRKANRAHYRKDGDALYEPKYNEKGQFVHAYQYVYDISDFVFQGLFPLEQNAYWYNCLTEKPGTAKATIASLTSIKTEWLPDLKRNDMIHAFSNGLYDLERNEFFHFEPTRPDQHSIDELARLVTNLTAIKYHDILFDEDGMNADIAKHPELGYMAIQFDEIDKLLRDQDFNELVERKFILAMGGRLLFPLGKFEQWQVFVYFLGLAGTGKSLFLRLVAKCLEKRDVAILNNALQRGFALDGVEKAKFFLGLDLDSGFQLDQATFNSMVSGEDVSITRKFKQPLTVVWTLHGGFAGNKLPNWEDNGGSLTRRVIVIEFLRKVTNSDPKLFEKCCLKMDRFLKLIVSAYHDFVAQFGKCNIKEAMPAKFRQSEKKALVELNVLAQFVSDTCDIVEYTPGSDNCVTHADILAVFKDFCIKQSIKPPKFCYTFYNGVFAKNLIKETKTPTGVTVFEGVRLKQPFRDMLTKKNA